MGSRQSLHRNSVQKSSTPTRRLNTGAGGARRPSYTRRLTGATTPRSRRTSGLIRAGTQHIPGGYLPSQGAGAQRPNGNEYNFASERSCRLDRWVRDNIAPPPSAHPRLEDKTLVPRDRMPFRQSPGVHPPLGIPSGYRADLTEPQSHPLPLLVPQVDSDGNELSGIRLPNVAVPLATYTGLEFS